MHQQRIPLPGEQRGTDVVNTTDDGTPLGEAPEIPGRTPPANTDRPIVFLDTETLGLEHDAPIWEFAAIRVNPLGSVKEMLFQIDHDDADEWLETLRPDFAEDYRTRYDPEFSRYPHAAASAIWDITAGAVIVGCNPAFDLDSQRLTARAAGAITWIPAGTTTRWIPRAWRWRGCGHVVCTHRSRGSQMNCPG